MSKLLITVCSIISLTSSAYADKIPCGLTGSIDERTFDCSHIEGSEKGVFKLVSRTNTLKEVWWDTYEGLIWSDAVYTAMGGTISSDSDETSHIQSSWHPATLKNYLDAEIHGGWDIILDGRFYWATDALLIELSQQVILGGIDSIYQETIWPGRQPEEAPTHFMRYVFRHHSPRISDCGKNGSIQERVLDCKARNVFSQRRELKLVAHEGKFQNEIWLDSRDGKLWWIDNITNRNIDFKTAKKLCSSSNPRLLGISGQWRLPHDYEVRWYRNSSFSLLQTLLPGFNWGWHEFILHWTSSMRLFSVNIFNTTLWESGNYDGDYDYDNEVGLCVLGENEL